MNFTFIQANIENVFVHKIGNKSANEQYHISKTGIVLTDDLIALLKQYFLSSFKSEELYHFYHDDELSLNKVYNIVNQIFESPESLYEQSVHLANYLYDQSVHPKIKSGEFYVTYFKDCILYGETLDAIGLFKSENKDIYLEVELVEQGFEMESRQGININRMDKGCIIFNTDKHKGYAISIIDSTNKGYEAHYWKDEFLKIKIIHNDFHLTNQFLNITKQFVTQQLPEDFAMSKADQINLLNRSVDYFKTHETFDKPEFETSVFGDSEVIDSFRKFDQAFRQEKEVELSDHFGISTEAVKKQARVFKSVLKLDKNFHIYIHGNRELIEQGIDESGRKYYKIYYEKEA